MGIQHVVERHVFQSARLVLPRALAAFDLVDLTDDAVPDDLLDPFLVQSPPFNLALRQGLAHIDVQLIVGLGLIIVLDFQKSQHRRDCLVEFGVLNECVLRKITGLALLAEEVFNDLVLNVDSVVQLARVASVGRRAVITSLGLGPLGALEIRFLVALLSAFLV